MQKMTEMISQREGQFLRHTTSISEKEVEDVRIQIIEVKEQRWRNLKTHTSKQNRGGEKRMQEYRLKNGQRGWVIEIFKNTPIKETKKRNKRIQENR